MNRKLLLALTLIFCLILVFTAVSCSQKAGTTIDDGQNDLTGNDSENSAPDGNGNKDPSQPAQNHSVQLIYNNGAQNKTVTVQSGKTLPTPEDPTRNNYIFLGWYSDRTLTTKYDFSTPVTGDLTLYAKYELDALKLTNQISRDTMKGVVKIHNTSYNSILGIKYDETTSQGSGFCFKVHNGCYYILTNNHVVTVASGCKKQQLTVEDYQGNVYEAYIYENPNKGFSAASAEYDLACIYFRSSTTNVTKLDLAKSNPEIGDDVVSVGAPQGQSNSINYGKMQGYANITLNETDKSESNVTFPAAQHNGYSNNGSSGGPLLNSELKVIGVNYAISKTTDKAYAIPVEKVYEFLKQYVYN